MGKIKNWDKKPRGSGLMRWVNRHPSATSKFGKPLSRASIQIDEDPRDGRKPYVVLVSRYAYMGDERVDKDSMQKNFNTKEKARKWAVQWMRNHPTG